MQIKAMLWIVHTSLTYFNCIVTKKWHKVCSNRMQESPTSLFDTMNTPMQSLLKTTAMSLLIGATQAFATPVEVTTADYNPTLWGFNGAGSLTSGGYSNRGNFGAAHEDNETEAGTIAGQQWDMEAIVLNGTQLSIVAGFDLLNGVQAHNIGAGDLFIKIGGDAPGLDPTDQGHGNVSNTLYAYTYAIDLSLATKFGNAGFGSTAQVYSLNNSSTLNTVIYDQFGSNPWKYDNSPSLNSGTGTPTGISYLSGEYNNSAALQALGLGWLQGGYHNILTIDLSFMVGTVTPDTPIYFSYTMECGNDSLKGQYSGGFDRVPDEVSSILLIGLGVIAIVAVGVKRRMA
jgi:hypothetical protein